MEHSTVILGIVLALLTMGAQGPCQKKANLGNSGTDGDTGPPRADTGSPDGDALVRDTGGYDTYSHSDTGVADSGPTSTDSGNNSSDTGRSDTDAGTSDPYEPNDSPSKADFLQPGQKGNYGRGVERKVAYADSGDVDWYAFTHETSKSNETDMFIEFSVLHRDLSAALDVELMRTTSGGGVKQLAKASQVVIEDLPLQFRTNSADVQDVAWYSVRHQPKRTNDQTYFLKVSGAQSKVRYTFLGYERRSERADTPTCPNDGAEPNDQTSSATVLQTLSQPSQFHTWYNKATKTRLCSSDTDVYKVTISGGEAYEFEINHLPTTSARLSVQAGSSVMFADETRIHSARRGFAVHEVELPSGSQSTDVYVTVENSNGSPYVGSYAFGYRRTK